MSQTVASGLLSFRAGPARLALPLEVVREVLEAPEIVAVPGCHPQVSGVTLHRGLALPVYDLERLPALWAREAEGGTPGSGEASHVVVCGYGEVLVGLQARTPDLLGAPDALRSGSAGPAEAVRVDFVSGVRPDGAEMVMILDPSRLFASLGVPDGVHADREGA